MSDGVATLAVQALAVVVPWSSPRSSSSHPMSIYVYAFAAVAALPQ